jgi:hypothetical protein
MGYNMGYNMELAQIIQKYLAVAGVYGKQVPLASLGLSKEETEDVFSVFDEDYHISRFFHLACAAAASSPSHSQIIFQINGFPQTHISVDAEVQSIL